MMISNVSYVMVTWDPPFGQNDGQTTENIIFPQLRCPNKSEKFTREKKKTNTEN